MANANNTKKTTPILEKALVAMLEDGKKEIWDKIGGQEIKNAIKAIKERGRLNRIGKGAEDLWIDIAARVNPKGSLRSRDLFMYALILCENMGHETFGDHEDYDDLGKLYLLFDLARRMQQPSGNFKWRWRDQTVLHRNAVDFCMWSASLICRRHKQVLKNRYPKTWKLLVKIIKDALPALKRREPECFTNTYLKNVHNLIMLGETFNWPKIKQMGYRRLDRFTIYTWEWGIHEYASPTYTGIHANCLGLIHRYTKNEKVKDQAKRLLKVVIKGGIRNLSTAANQFVGTRSRRHSDYFQGEANIHETLWLAEFTLREPPRTPMRLIFPALYLTDSKAFWFKQPLAKLVNKPLQEAKDRFPIDYMEDQYAESVKQQNKGPLLLRESWGPTENESRTTYFQEGVTLSTSSASYDYPSGEDLPLTAELIGSPFVHHNDIKTNNKDYKFWKGLRSYPGDPPNNEKGLTNLQKEILPILFEQKLLDRLINQAQNFPQTTTDTLKPIDSFRFRSTFAKTINEVIQQDHLQLLSTHLDPPTQNNGIYKLAYRYMEKLHTLPEYDKNHKKLDHDRVKRFVEHLKSSFSHAIPFPPKNDIKIRALRETQKLKRFIIDAIFDEKVLNRSRYLWDYFPQKVVGTSRCYFLSDTEHDPYGKNKRHHTPLHWAAAQKDNQALGLVLYKPKVRKLLESNFVIPSNVDEIWINDTGSPDKGKSYEMHELQQLRHIQLSPPRYRNRQLQRPTVVLRKGCTVIGFQVVWANNLKGDVPPIQLCHDNLDYEHFGKVEKYLGKNFGKIPALRLTVQHHLLSENQSFAEKQKKNPWTNPGFAILVKVDHLRRKNQNKTSLDDFGDWCKKFGSETVYTVDRLEEWKRNPSDWKKESPIKSFEIKSLIKNKKPQLHIYTYAPDKTRFVSKLTPPPSRAVLESKNLDIARQTLKDIHAIQTYNNLSNLPVITLSKAKDAPNSYSARWHAKDGRITKPIRTGEDLNKKRSQFIWIPSQGSQKRGSDIGNVLWQISTQGAKTDKYYIWGKIKAPNKNSDRFYMRITNSNNYQGDFSSFEQELPQGTWLTGRHKKWTWVPLDLSEVGESSGPTAIELEENQTYYLQLFAQRAGIKLQELYITNRWDDTPEQQDRRKYRPKRKP